MITGADGTIRYVNPAFASITGYSPNEVVGQHPRMFRSGCEPESLYTHLWSVVRSGHVWNGAMLNRRKDGTVYEEDVRITPVLDGNGKIDGYIGIRRQVTGQRNAEQTQALLAAIVESSEDAIISYTPTGTVLTWNRGAESIMGYTAAQAVGMPVSGLVPADRSEKLQILFDQVRSGECVSQYQGLGLRRDGSTIHISVTACPIRNHLGEITAISTVVRDVTERQASDRTKAVLSSIVESSDDAIWSTGPDGRIAGWNHGAERMLGYSREEAVGAAAETLGLPAEHDRVSDAELRAKGGMRVEVSLSGATIRNAVGEPAGLSCIARDIGQRLAAERKLAESEARFRQIFENAPIGLAVTSLEKRFIQVNGSLCRMLGYSEEELLRTTWAQLTHPDDLELSRQRFRGLRNTDDYGVWDSEKRYIHRTGGVVWVRIRISTLRNSDGSPRCFVLHAEDITERRSADAALQESEERFRVMADSCPAMMWVTDAEGGNQFINRAYQEFCGADYDDPGGVKWQLLIHPEDTARCVREALRATRDRTRFSSDVRMRRADGEWRWITSVAEPRFSATGAFLGHVGIAQDITERKQAETLARQTSERLTLATRAGAVGIWEMNIAENRLVWDDQMFRLYGYDPGAGVDALRVWEAGVHPEDRQRCDREVQAVLSGVRDFDTEFRVRWPNGSTHTIRAIAQVQRDCSGQPLRVIGTNWDITALRNAAEELLLSNRKLAEANATANEMATEAARANAAKSRFLANMSHEIRTPMNGVIGTIQLLLKTDLTAEQEQYATVAERSGRALLHLIDDILDLSKIEAGRIVLEEVAFGLQDVLDEVVKTLRSLADQKGLRLDLHTAPEIPRGMSGDPHRLGQVLTNLVANAIKFTESGTIVVRAALDSAAGDRLTVRFSVTDSGIGIAPEQVRSLFSPFMQADSSTTRQYGGSGLGLAISKQLVEMMAGTIGVETVPGRGSTFWFTAVFGKVAETPAPAEPAPALVSRDRPTARILVAEDNAVNRLVILAQLKKLGYEGTAVNNGAEAVEALRKGGFDLVVMDCQMPLMDGFEAARRIRGSIDADLPIIALTAGALREDRARCLAEMNDYLSKPVSMDRLSEVLERWLRHSPKPVVRIPDSRECRNGSFDEAELLERLGDRRIAGLILKGFLEHVPLQLNRLREVLEHADTEGVLAQAHSLKGSAATVSAVGLCALAKAIENAGNEGRLDRCAGLAAQTEGEVEKFREAVQAGGWL